MARRASRATAPRPSRSRRSDRAARSVRRAAVRRHAPTVAPRRVRIPSISAAYASENFWTPSSSSTCRRRRSRGRSRRDGRAGRARIEVLEDGVAPHLAVILERLHGLERHGVHRLGADQLLDVDHVAVFGVLRRGGGPRQRCGLAPAASSSRQRSIAQTCSQCSYASFAFAIASSPRDRAPPRCRALEPLVRLGVDARHEEARDGAHLRDVAAALVQPLDAATYASARRRSARARRSASR